MSIGTLVKKLAAKAYGATVNSILKLLQSLAYWARNAANVPLRRVLLLSIILILKLGPSSGCTNCRRFVRERQNQEFHDSVCRQPPRTRFCPR